MDTPTPRPPATRELRAPTRPRSEAEAWQILGVSGHPGGDSAISIDGVRAQALAHAARTLAGWLLPAADSAAERDSLGAALALVLMFGWGIAGRVGASARHLGMDHDGTVRLWGGAEEDRAAVERALSGVRET